MLSRYPELYFFPKTSGNVRPDIWHLDQEMKITTATESVFRELVKQLNKTQKLLMWDLLFKTFPPLSGKWKWRWYTGTFKCTRVLFIWETLKPETLLQLALPRAILPLYSRGNHTSIYNTRHACTHTSDGEREREKEKGQNQKERLSGNPATPRTPAVFKGSDRKTARMKQWLSKNTMA